MKVSSIGLAATGAALLSILAVSASAQSNPPVQNSAWAVVSARGDMLSGQNTTAVKHEGKGHYEVDFSGPVNKCAYTATIGGDTKLTRPGSIVVARVKGVKNAVLVGIYDVVTLLPDNNRFMINVSC